MPQGEGKAGQEVGERTVVSEAERGEWGEGERDDRGTTRTSVSPPSKTMSATLKLENQPDCLLYQY